MCVCIYMYVYIPHTYSVFSAWDAKGVWEARKSLAMSWDVEWDVVPGSEWGDHRTASPGSSSSPTWGFRRWRHPWTSKASGRERAYTTGRLHLMELGGNSECCSTIGSLLPIPLFLARLPAILSAICLFRSSWRSFQALKWNFEKKSEYGNFFPSISKRI